MRKYACKTSLSLRTGSPERPFRDAPLAKLSLRTLCSWIVKRRDPYGRAYILRAFACINLLAIKRILKDILSKARVYCAASSDWTTYIYDGCPSLTDSREQVDFRQSYKSMLARPLRACATSQKRCASHAEQAWFCFAERMPLCGINDCRAIVNWFGA